MRRAVKVLPAPEGPNSAARSLAEDFVAFVKVKDMLGVSQRMEGPGRHRPRGEWVLPGGGRMGRNGRGRLDPLEGDVVVEGHDGFGSRRAGGP